MNTIMTIDLDDFLAAGAISQTDLDVARGLCRLAGEVNELVLLACAITVNVTSSGSVCWRVGNRVLAGLIEDYELSWPDTEQWLAAIQDSPLITSRPAPLVLADGQLYLERYWRGEQRLADELISRRRHPHEADEELLRQGLARLFPQQPTQAPDGTMLEPDERQRAAAEFALTRRLSVIAGGPGTGKTTTLARIFALFADQALASGRRPMIVLAAPTGRAAARLQSAVNHYSGIVSDLRVQNAMRDAQAKTLHRLLGFQPFNQSRFARNRNNPLPYDVVIVDECSMISLSMMESLVDAMAPGSQLVLVGDPQQLMSVDAGTVFGDIVGATTSIDEVNGIVVLQRVHRYGHEIGALATAVLTGDTEAAIAVLDPTTAPVANAADTGSGLPALQWVRTGEDWASDPQLAAAVSQQIYTQLDQLWLSMIDNAVAGRDAAALADLDRCRILCAHRSGPYGAFAWNRNVFRHLATQRPLGWSPDQMYPGRPLMVRQNDYELGIYNGDTAVITASADGEVGAAFGGTGSVFTVAPQRLGHVESAYASTVHKSQGSQFDTVVLVLPPAGSRILGRQLLYTAITRARERVIICGSEESLRAAIDRQDLRFSGLRNRLWE